MKFKNLWKKGCCTAFALLLSMSPQSAFSRIKLTTLPKRERVEIQLDNNRYTLVEEVRIIPLLQSNPQRGNNKIDFSWSNTHVHKDTILFRPIAIRTEKGFREIQDLTLANGQKTAEVKVLNVSYPPGENALVWEIYAQKACAVKVRVTYLISNLKRWFSYRAQTDKNETLLNLRQYVHIRNQTGEDFGTAKYWIGVWEKLPQTDRATSLTEGTCTQIQTDPDRKDLHLRLVQTRAIECSKTPRIQGADALPPEKPKDRWHGIVPTAKRKSTDLYQRQPR